MSYRAQYGRLVKLLYGGLVYEAKTLGQSLLTTSLLQSWVYVLLFTAWATCVALICDKVHDLSFDSALLTVFGTILGFIISFRTSTAFERYNEGKKLLASIAYASRTFARLVWFHVPLESSTGVLETSARVVQVRQDLAAPPSLSNPADTVSKSPEEILEEKETIIKLIKAFNCAVKQHLRNIGSKQIALEVNDTCGEVISTQERPSAKRMDSSWGSDVTAHETPNQSNDVVIDIKAEPMDEKDQQITDKPGVGGISPISSVGPVISPQTPSRPKSPADNVPLEISFCLSSYIVKLQERKTNESATNNMLIALNLMVQAFTDLEKVSADQIPFSYRFQVWCCAYLYIFFLPFQLWQRLSYISIPGTSLAALIFLGLLSAGEEIENPFNGDRNDLDMDKIYEDFSREMKTLMATKISTSDSETEGLKGRIDRVIDSVERNEREAANSDCQKTWLRRQWEQAESSS